MTIQGSHPQGTSWSRVAKRQGSTEHVIQRFRQEGGKEASIKTWSQKPFFRTERPFQTEGRAQAVSVAGKCKVTRPGRARWGPRTEQGAADRAQNNGLTVLTRELRAPSFLQVSLT